MGIASHKPDATPPVTPGVPSVEPATYQSVIVDNNKTPLNSLIAYMEGAPWTVDYYSQVLSKHNDLRDHDPGQVNLYQQYSKIVGLEIRVTTPLTNSQDTESTLVTVTGNALTYPFMTPNVGDVFVGDAGGGRKGVYKLSNVERKTFNTNSVFSIDYELLGYVDVAKDRFNDLENKVTQTYYFSKERMLEGLSPTLVQTEYKQMLDLTMIWSDLCQFYFRTFYNREFSTLVLPGQESSIYDSFLVDYLLRIVDTFDAEEVRYIKNLTTENEPFMQQNQFWKVLFERDANLLAYCNREMGLTYVKAFGADPMMMGIRYTRIRYLVYPQHPDFSTFSDKVPEVKPDATFMAVVRASSRPASISALLTDTLALQNGTVPFIKPLLEDSGYVFSLPFYEQGSQLSVLESLTLDYLKGNALSIDHLWKLVNQYPKWGRLEQFYYIPVLLTLIKATRQGLY